MAPDASEIRRALQVYDRSGAAGGAREALGMLAGITKEMAQDPAKFDLNIDPSEKREERAEQRRRRGSDVGYIRVQGGIDERPLGRPG